MNHLEQLVAEWYEYNGYFVRRNVLVGKRAKGGHESELDIIAFNPTSMHLIHIETSMDAQDWSKREERYKKKFEAGRRYIPELFKGIAIPEHIEQIALFGVASKANHSELSGGHVWLVSDLLLEIVSDLKRKPIAKEAVPQQFPLIRTIQFICQYEKALFGVG